MIEELYVDLDAVAPSRSATQVGQFIGTRPDFIPMPICKKLTLLQDKVHSLGGVVCGRDASICQQRVPL